MKIGFAPAGSRDSRVAVAMALHAEKLGLAEVWVSEDYLERGSFSVAGGIAAVTERVNIGLGVINPWTRHVALTAMECAALDELSDGRLIVGVGASNAAWMEGLLGIPFEKPIERLVEYVRGLRGLLAGDHVTTSVGGLPLDAELSFRPLRPNIPIQLGVKGPIALRRGAAVADGLMLSVLSSPAYVRWIRSEHPEMPLTAYAFVATDDDGAEARDRLRPRVGRFLGIHGPTEITARASVPAELASRFSERLVAKRDASDLVTDDHLANMTVSGTLEDAAAAARAYADAGLDVLVAMDDGVTDPIVVVERIAAIANAADL
jgi:5,10-methylenetetrahydromethanopterin reductase